jgi:hypothetical protein
MIYLTLFMFAGISFASSFELAKQANLQKKTSDKKIPVKQNDWYF